MRKYKMMALTGILLSSTILGANTSVVQAKDAEEITVDKNSYLDALENVIASNVNPEQKYSELTDGQTLTVKPIYYSSYTTKTAYRNQLKSELNVVDSMGAQVPMELLTFDPETGFATQVKYRDIDGGSKVINVKYNFSVPMIHSSITEPLNYKDGDLPSDFNDVINGGTLNTANANIQGVGTNGTDLNGDGDKTNVSITKAADSDIATKGGTIGFTATDTEYSKLNGSDLTSAEHTRKVNIFKTPNWSELDSRTLQKGDTNGLKEGTTISDDNGNVYLVTVDDPSSVDLTKAGNNTVDYTASAIDVDNGGMPVNATNGSNRITYTKKNQTLKVSDDTADVNYNVVIVDKNTGNTVASYSATGADGSTATVDSSKIPSDYSLSDAQKTFTVDANNPTKIITVAKTVNYDITYKDAATGAVVGSAVTGSGKEGDSVLLTSPDGYKFANDADMIYTLKSNGDNSTVTKTVYLNKKITATKNLGYTIQYKDVDTGDLIDETTGTGDFGDYVSASAPKGYAFSGILSSYGFVLIKNGQTYTSYVKKANTSYNISYVDQATDKEVGTASGKEANGTTITLTAPKGYSFVTADDINYTVDADNPSSTIYVKKNDDSNVEANDIVATYPEKGKYVKIYDADGNLNDSVVLSAGTSWIIDQTREINGEEYYRVATNEYIKASDAYKYTPLQSVVTTKNGDVKPVYNSKGQLVLDLALDYNTPWYTDRSATINGEKMYRVATDEWVRAADVNEG